MSETQETINRMILDELRGQRRKLDSVGTDVAVVKDKVASIERQQEKFSEKQEEFADRLTALEKKPASNLDWKALLKIVTVIGVAVAGATRGIPESAWSALIGLLGG